MNCTLANHARGYHLSFSDGLLSAVTLSGIPYAKRHWDLSNTTCRLGHRIIAAAESIPVLGALIALIERVVASFFSQSNMQTPNKMTTPISSAADVSAPTLPTCNHCKQRALTPEEAQKKMLKNQEKATKEHLEKVKTNADKAAYASIKQAIPSLESLKNSGTALTLTFGYSEAKGIRPAMEDAHFHLVFEKGVVYGVFDGHNGDAVAKYACEQFQKKFPQALTEAKDNVHLAFETLFHTVHSEITHASKWDKIGTTAVVCFVEKASNIVYTATLGDSEATVYRNFGKHLKAIPLSCVRDWSSAKDYARALAVHQGTPAAEFINKWNTPGSKAAQDPKERRFHSNLMMFAAGQGLNVSRSLGDKECMGSNSTPGVIHKPKITMNKLQSGDTLVLGCDGLKDFVSEKEMVEQLSTTVDITADALAKKLVTFALTTKKSTDNVTVIVVKAS